MAPGALAEGEDVHVVVDPDGRFEMLLEPAAHVEAVPAGHDRRGDRASALEVHRAGEAHGDRPHRAAVVACGEFVDHLERLCDRVGRTVRDRPIAVRLPDDAAIEVGETDVDVQGAERADDDASLLAAEAQGAWCSPTRRRAERGVLDVAHLDRLVDALGDDTAPEPREPSDLGAGGRLACADHVHDAQQARHLVGLRAEAQGGLCSHA
jgi:hypothetical protein